ncbi:vitamin K epoxide reductase family protein [Hymenobacter aerophilus]|uniref:vitamin K epoxide reductase family protein n=1 Tax=Hymenobacter aerophilus TaxID=119644 RepID=UPI00036E46B2|nr:vitamin K epoxide reductase family protein [Hymenobacter aerophilus]
MNPTQLSHELREGQSPDMTRRRWIIGLSLVGVAAGQIVSMYQTGIIHHLPDPPIGPFNSDKVDASDYGYKRLDTPDALPMIVTYGLTATLAGAGGLHRATDKPLLPVAMGAKTLFDVLNTVKLGQEEWQENKALCFYCQVATVASFASLALAIPEAVKGLKKLLGKG